MKLRTSDDKGRITINEKGKPYTVHEQEDGTIVLHPIGIPDVPKFERNDLRAIYVRTSASLSGADSVTIYSSFGNPRYLAYKVSELAAELKIPVVVEARGVGAGVADVLEEKGIEVVRRYQG